MLRKCSGLSQQAGSSTRQQNIYIAIELKYTVRSESNRSTCVHSFPFMYLYKIAFWRIYTDIIRRFSHAANQCYSVLAVCVRVCKTLFTSRSQNVSRNGFKKKNADKYIMCGRKTHYHLTTSRYRTFQTDENYASFLFLLLSQLHVEITGKILVENCQFSIWN